MRAGHLREGPVLGDAHKGQALLEAQGPLGPLYNVHKVDVAIPNLLHLQQHNRATNKISLGRQNSARHFLSLSMNAHPALRSHESLL